MTGFGSASGAVDDKRWSVEIKAVNGRFFKLQSKLPAIMQDREITVENKLKARLVRGSVSLSVHYDDPRAAVSALNETAVRAYQDAFRRLGLREEGIPSLPGVWNAAPSTLADDALWAHIEKTIDAATDALVAMRRREGAAMAEALRTILQRVETLHAQVAERAPVMVTDYQEKLRVRVARLLEGSDAPVDEQSLAREVAYFADRSDITEELDRLRAHIEHAHQHLNDGGEAGRQLEFLAQEMLREVNTIGSKSSDAQIAKLVLGLKGEVERIKEQVANIA